MEHLQYPIGRFNAPTEYTAELRAQHISTLRDFPQQIRAAVAGLSDAQLNTPYREGGWTIRQVVHHCSDSHMNGIIRLKLALTENSPTIKPYDEAAWAQLADSTTLPVEPALSVIEGVHMRWAAVLESLAPADFGRTFVHPQYGHVYTIDEQTALYAWHSRHHLAHITSLKARMGW